MKEMNFCPLNRSKRVGRAPSAFGVFIYIDDVARDKMITLWSHQKQPISEDS
jgi:hypothetical protein